MQGTAQGLFSASAGLATIVGSMVGGAIAGMCAGFALQRWLVLRTRI